MIDGVNPLAGECVIAGRTCKIGLRKIAEIQKLVGASGLQEMIVAVSKGDAEHVIGILKIVTGLDDAEIDALNAPLIELVGQITRSLAVALFGEDALKDVEDKDAPAG